nr:hypothetical protein GCM10020063_024200 [Dactylosporangium thailandense]
MPAPHARKRQSTVDAHRYDTAYVVIAVPIPGAEPDDVAPPLVYLTQPHGRHDRNRHP